jgi:hypothetical protein
MERRWTTKSEGDPFFRTQKEIADGTLNKHRLSVWVVLFANQELAHSISTNGATLRRKHRADALLLPDHPRRGPFIFESKPARSSHYGNWGRVFLPNLARTLPHVHIPCLQKMLNRAIPPEKPRQ